MLWIFGFPWTTAVIALVPIYKTERAYFLSDQADQIGDPEIKQISKQSIKQIHI